MQQQATILDDKKLRYFARSFKKGLLGEQSSVSKCYMVCAPLHTYLKILGIKVMLRSGWISTDDGPWNHFWLELPDGRILDPTANQFKKPNGKSMPEIYIGHKPDWYKDNL